MPASRATTVNAALREWLGQAMGGSEQKLIHAVEQGFPLSLIARLRAKGLSTQELEIIIKPRTLKHRRSRKERLSKEESDRLLRTANLLSLAESVLGNKEAAFKWLRTAKRRFDGRTPFEMMSTEAGSRLVEQMLVQIDEGMVA